jgi:hypothetical protein
MPDPSAGLPPRYLVYALDDLKTWADLGTKTSTSDPGVGTVLPAKRNVPVSSAYAKASSPKTRAAFAAAPVLAAADREGGRVFVRVPK